MKPLASIRFRWLIGSCPMDGICAGGRYWDRTSDLFGVKAASIVYVVPARQVLYGASWVYVSGRASWCWLLLEGMFLPCSLCL